MDLREQFEKETNKKLETTTTFDCRGCDLEQEVDIWNDSYIFWLESKVKKLNIDDVSNCLHTYEPFTKGVEICTKCDECLLGD